MAPKNSPSIFTNIYRLARSSKLLENKLAEKAFVSTYFLYKRFWEDPFQKLIDRQPQLFGDGDILDIGANIGYTSCLFANTLGPGCKVYCFEPDRANFRLLQEVVSRKKLGEKIIMMNAAVGNANGFIDFWHNENHSGDHRVATQELKRSLPESAPITTVPVVSIDSFVEQKSLEKISFVKIDVQGFEWAVCDGMRNTLRKFPGLNIAVEFAPEALMSLGYKPAALIDFLRTYDYQIHILTRSGLQPKQDNTAILQFADNRGYADLLCTRQGL